MIADTTASKPIYISLLKQAIVTNGKANNFHTRLKLYDTILEVDSDIAPDEFASRERQILNGETSIQTIGKVSRSCRNCGTFGGYFWGHMLNRNRFSIDQVLGEKDTTFRLVELAQENE